MMLLLESLGCGGGCGGGPFCGKILYHIKRVWVRKLIGDWPSGYGVTEMRSICFHTWFHRAAYLLGYVCCTPRIFDCGMNLSKPNSC
jgi:hypothetical protein